MTDLKTLSDKLHALIHNNAPEMRDQEFRMAVEELIRDSEEDAGPLLAPYITDKTIKPEVRMNIIRSAGYLLHPQYLIPLKNIIDNEANIRIKQEAIISVAKYNDRRALNILNSALQNLNNPMLARTINTEIHRIKQNNPILGLLPRFLEGSKNPKTFKITLDILKRILTPTDAELFSKYLTSSDKLVQYGAFELLCLTGDVFYDNTILEFFFSCFRQIPCVGQKECDELYYLTIPLQQFLSRYQFLVREQAPILREQFPEINDIRVQTLYIAIIGKSPSSDDIAFLNAVYQKKEKLRKDILESVAGNEHAADFLFEKYNHDLDQRETAIKSLLNTEKGLQYFTENFFSLPFEVQEIVALNLPYSGARNLSDFIRNVFESDTFRLKEIMMEKIRENYEFSARDILFDPRHEREFSFMSDKYLDAISSLFPVSAVKFIFDQIVSGKLSVAKTKKQLTILSELMPYELVFTFRDREFIAKLFERIVMSNNKELSLVFLGVLKYIKTFDIETYRIIIESLNLFITKREKHLSPEERGELERIKRNLRDLFHEFRRLEEGEAEMKRLFAEKEPDFDLLDKIIKNYQGSIVFHTGYFTENLSRSLAAASQDIIATWTRLLLEYPRIAGLIAPAIKAKADHSQTGNFRDLAKLASELDESQSRRIVLNFFNKQLTAFMRETLTESAPGILFETNVESPDDWDILLCDPEALNEMTLAGRNIPKKIYLFLEKAEGFADFRNLNPRSFVAPFSYYRIMREILGNYYL